MTYEEFVHNKKKSVLEAGFNVADEHINQKLFDFQRYAVRKALSYGRYALFEECGLGKTFQQIEWANHIVRNTNQKCLVLAPLGVTGQTIKEAEKLDIE